MSMSKSTFCILSTVVLSVVLALSLVATHTKFAYASISQGSEAAALEANKETAANSRSEAQEITKAIRSLPENAGYAERDQIAQIRKQYDGYSKKYLFSNYVSKEDLAKLEAAEERASHAPTFFDEFGLLGLVMVAWGLIYLIQQFVAFASAWYKIKRDNAGAMAYIGWLIAYGFAALVPGLGFYIFKKNKGSLKTQEA